ncbi:MULTISPECIES: TadE/TadG family type IV pilus assembly protein [Bradyrhizobium]|uniref:TadE/TadG family type IV pilus assembly protein n=1 Tax=Bradyrhizobium TaxID=374 RepID=UPI00155EA246|nr:MULTISPECIES: TadE/TadG family type IV pilus assembly protein [Bradyrhizobium]MBR1165585.1 pilus assembly protein [Bradyrhizobium liaoningense]MDD1517438.1 pilus assembly protein TadG [Bradyrhizobium sp. WBAH30]MDD1541747.1 pilus assembly protein TadG [Bradyrhizobium sp. WBAH41]MDD1555387.1 pilus assembly protein TadG [Bradyrhizobium sp. WBAH23]MDD1564218.1 pilus assembly protein TadG [Bradyrhizobium sp. WBAH33]
MPSPAPTRFTLRKALLRFRGNRRGSAAVEFALVAPMFFALLFAIIETALMFFSSQVLETIAQDSARAILTGQAQAQGGSVAACQTAPNTVSACDQTTFKAFVCTKIPALFDCSKLYVDVVSTSSFGTLSLTNFGTSCTFNPSGMQYSAGSSGQVVVVRLFYQWPLIVTGLGYNMGCNNKRLMVATAAFKNEPF